MYRSLRSDYLSYLITEDKNINIKNKKVMKVLAVFSAALALVFMVSAVAVGCGMV
ncbi:MAG: hypothetical protein ACXVAY_00380 [Mucilaginibacter sp.]